MNYIVVLRHFSLSGTLGTKYFALNYLQNVSTKIIVFYIKTLVK